MESGSCGNCWPQQPPDQPDDQRDKRSQKDKGETENQEQPDGAAENRNIALNGGRRIASDPSPEYRHIAVDRHVSTQTHTTTKGGCVAGDLAVILHYDTSGKCGCVTGDMPADPDGATEACGVAYFLVGANHDVVPELSAVMAYVGECCGGNVDNAQQHSETRQQPHDDLQAKVEWF